MTTNASGYMFKARPIKHSTYKRHEKDRLPLKADGSFLMIVLDEKIQINIEVPTSGQMKESLK